MKRFWIGIIKPIIEGLKPNAMIEIGVDKGENTINILEYCLENNCNLISIDPLPDSSVSELEYEYENQFTLIRDLSLNVLSDVGDAQVFFIDGDHNWYTVYNELKVIQDNAKEHFPLIFLHDVEWPYARRDLYYNPDAIPPKYTNKYARRGIDLHSKQLTEKIGVNSALNNALESDTPKNGVFTAVEDFLNTTDFDLKSIIIPGFHGLGIIYDQNTYLENIAFKRSIDNLIDSLEIINDYIRELSYAHYYMLNQNAFLEGKTVSIETLNWEFSNKINILNENEKTLKENINNLGIELVTNNEEIVNKNEEIVKIRGEIGNLLLKKNEEIGNKNEEIGNKNEEIGNLESRLLIENLKLGDLEQHIKTLSRSRKKEFHKNFQILFSEYLSRESVPNNGRLAQLSNIPYLFILFKSKGNLKKAWINIKGYRAIKSLELFDEAYYLNKYTNVLVSGMNPLIQYMYYGYKENKFPSPIFDGDYYLNKYENVKESGMNPLVHYSLYGINEGKKTKTDNKVSVVVTSYNHGKYIRECIDSILMQKGVEIELIVGDDCSKDNTRKILEEYQKQHPEIMKLMPITENMGVTKNLERCLEAVTKDYVAICEGDDYWTDPYKLKKQAKFLEKRQDCAMCFNSILMFYEDNEEKNYNFQEKLTKDTFTTRELILENFIGNFSCCMYRSDVVKNLPDTLYNLFTVDWIFNITCSLYGNIGFLNEQMTVYRKHDNALWSSKSSIDQCSELSEYIDTYNKFLSFKFDSEFKNYKKRLNEQIKKKRPKLKKSGLQDLIIIDDVFPNPLSAFRLQEYNSYLDYFEDVKVFCKNETFQDKESSNIIENYGKKYPQFKNKIENFDPETILEAKGIYTIFLNNIYHFIDIIEKYKIPFIFSLYPGGGFYLNNEISDHKLKRIFSSPYFRKVIVTQKITKEYLIDNKFCKTEQIEEIFGVVTPLELLEKECNDKMYFGRDKSRMDICFIAYKYTEKGVDKGYDVFLEVANELSKNYKNIHFHVVGNFDENVLDSSSIKDRISFYGPQLSEWFKEFYKDKDIILSPNIPFKLSEGAFDGFPTGCCTEAGLHKVAIFCTDELKLNTKKYKDKEEIVIIPHDTQKIVEIIEEYYHNPKKLQEVSELGYLKIKELYNYENQIEPRINILEGLISDFK